jgi:hypothetical protein
MIDIKAFKISTYVISSRILKLKCFYSFDQNLLIVQICLNFKEIRHVRTFPNKLHAF